MRVLVTGGTGFIGSHLLEALVARGDTVVSIERPGADRRWIADLPLIVRRAALGDADALDAACDGAGLVIHLAGLTRARTQADYDHVNAEGTAALLRAAATQYTPPHVVVVSSFSAMGPCRDGLRLGERTVPYPQSPYGLSKLRAEAVVHAWADRVPATIVRPSSVYGPRERSILKVFRMVQHGFALTVGDWDREVQLLHVDDLVRALLRIGDDPRTAGRTWCAAHPEPVSWRAFATTVGLALERQPRLVSVPRAVAAGIARAAEVAALVRGRAASLNRDRVRELEGRWVCETRIWDDLGLQPQVSLEDGVPSTVAWYRRTGWLETRSA